MTDTGLISSIFKSACLLLLALGCSSGPKSAYHQERNSELERAIETLPADDRPPPGNGPTQPTKTNGFVDRTQDYGLEGVEGVWFGSLDLNQDQFSDLVVLPGYFHQPQFFLFDPVAHKFVRTESSFSESTSASYLTFADFNGDGVLDVIVGVLNQRGEFTKLPLTLWNGSWDAKGRLHFTRDLGFIKTPAEATSAVIPIDVNLDGKLDLFVGNWYVDFKGAQIPSADRLLVQTADGWEDRSDWLSGERNKTANDLFPPGARPTYGASTCDMNQDGWPDILTASSGGYSNKLWLNLPPRPGPVVEGRRFEDVARESSMAADANGVLVPTGGGRTFTAVCADYNDDGIMDIFLGELTHSWDNQAVDRSSILTGARPTLPLSFLRTEYMSDNQAENWNQGDKRALWADLNLDGLVDLVVDNSGFPPHSRLVSFMQDETRAFTNVAQQWGLDVVNPTGTILVDLNQDGKLDMITGQTNIREASIKNRIYVLENHLTTSGRGRTFFLSGKKGNTHGLGAMIMLYTLVNGKQVVQRRWNEWVQGGLASQNPEGIHFGLDSDAKLLGVKVRWPVTKGNTLRSGQVLERMYRLEDRPKLGTQSWTLCEDGRNFEGRFSCN